MYTLLILPGTITLIVTWLYGLWSFTGIWYRIFGATAYHFTTLDGRLGYFDGRQVIVGETISVKGSPDLCAFGLHGSVKLQNAMGYAWSGKTRLWKVRIWGSLDIGSNKLCGRHRMALVDYGDLRPVWAEFRKEFKLGSYVNLDDNYEYYLQSPMAVYRARMWWKKRLKQIERDQRN